MHTLVRAGVVIICGAAAAASSTSYVFHHESMHKGVYWSYTGLGLHHTSAGVETFLLASSVCLSGTATAGTAVPLEVFAMAAAVAKM